MAHVTVPRVHTHLKLMYVYVVYFCQWFSLLRLLAILSPSRFSSQQAGSCNSCWSCCLLLGPAL